MNENQELNEIRKKIFLTAYSASIAHIASAFSIVEILYVLYCKKVLNYDSKNPYLEDRDKFILSKGHGSLALYVILSKVGFFNEKLLKSFSKPGSILGGEPIIGEIPGIEATTGSLGHGLSFGVGIALANKMDNKKSKVYVLVGDGECEEGSIWEALMFSAHKKLDNLVIILDSNKIQKMGSVEDIMSITNWKERFKTFNFNVKEVDGHNIKELENTFNQENITGMPTIVICNTIKGKGVSIIENDSRWHWRLPNKKELKVFMKELNITEKEIEECRKLI